jgi:hypothetical protein
MWWNDKVRLKDCRLWDGVYEVYLCGYPFSLSCAGEEILSGELDIYDDRRIAYALDRTGLRYIFYTSPTGFKKIVLE